MLVYQATKSEFMIDVDNDAISAKIEAAFTSRIHRPHRAEIRSWRNSMEYMYKVLNTDAIPDSCGVAVEFKVPNTDKRIDFLLSGFGERENLDYAAIIVELKQWEKLESVPGHDGLVRTYTGGAEREVTHPSYQAWSYSRMIEDYNEAVRDEHVDLAPCAYLHNYVVADGYDPLLDPAYLEYLERAPVFCSGDVLKLRDFICRHIKNGDDGRVLYHIEAGRLRPSKSLQDALVNMLEGNQSFVLIDDQKVVFEQAVSLALEARDHGKRRVMIVRGGPGTGKSVVAINLLVRLTEQDMVVQYVSKNSAPRNVYSKKLRSADKTKSYVDGLFKGTGGFYLHEGDPIDTVVVDEAHRLNEKSGFYSNEGENQIQEIIAASRFAVFFIDESQRITLKDIGRVSDIKRFAVELGAEVIETDLMSQFRCNGSNGYLDWLDDILGVMHAPRPVVDLEYDFRVFDDPHDLFEAIQACNADSDTARVVAGYCWEWPAKSKNDPSRHDVVIPEHDFAKSWNVTASGTWAIDRDAHDQIGCVHTTQGLEFDYVGVIIGDDMRFEHGAIVTDPTKRAKSDASLKGLKKLAATDPARAAGLADEIIRNTYRVLMTRGMRGCYVFCTDKALAEHLRDSVPPRNYRPRDVAPPQAAETPRRDDR